MFKRSHKSGDMHRREFKEAQAKKEKTETEGAFEIVDGNKEPIVETRHVIVTLRVRFSRAWKKVSGPLRA